MAYILYNDLEISLSWCIPHYKCNIALLFYLLHNWIYQKSGFKLDFDVLKVIYIIWGYLCVMKFMRLFRLSKWIYVLHHTLLHMDFRSEHFRAITILPLLTSSAALYLFFWYDSMNHFSNKLYNPHWHSQNVSFKEECWKARNTSSMRILFLVGG